MSDVITLPPGAPTVPPAKRRWYLRPWFIIPAALVLIAAVVVTVLVSLPSTITVRGRVIDQLRPDLGVAAATLRAGGATATTNAAGGFTMTGVSQNATLQVRALYYHTATASASASALTIRLVPIPVTVSVTSAMTGQPVPATISAPAGKPVPYTISSGETIRLYRAGPGETLTITASGYRSAQAAVSRARKLTAALEPTTQTLWLQVAAWASQGKYTQIADWVLRPATGYAFIKPTPQEQAEIDKLVQSLKSRFQPVSELLLYYTARGIVGSTASVELAVMKPGPTLDVQTWANSVVGHAARVTISGQNAWHGGPDSDGEYDTFASVGIFNIAVFGDSTAETDHIMTGILDALLGNGTAA